MALKPFHDLTPSQIYLIPLPLRHYHQLDVIVSLFILSSSIHIIFSERPIFSVSLPISTYPSRPSYIVAFTIKPSLAPQLELVSLFYVYFIFFMRAETRRQSIAWECACRMTQIFSQLCACPRMTSIDFGVRNKCQ